MKGKSPIPSCGQKGTDDEDRLRSKLSLNNTRGPVAPIGSGSDNITKRNRIFALAAKAMFSKHKAKFKPEFKFPY